MVEQRRLAAAAQVSSFNNATRGGAQCLRTCWQFWAVRVGSEPSASSPSVSFGTDLSRISQLGAAAIVQPSPEGGELTPGAGSIAASTSQQIQQSATAMAAALLASLQTPRQPQSPPTPTTSTESGIEVAILRMQKAPYDAVSSQQKVMKEMTDLLPDGGGWKDFNRNPGNVVYMAHSKKFT